MFRRLIFLALILFLAACTRTIPSGEQRTSVAPVAKAIETSTATPLVPAGVIRYAAQPGTPVAIANFLYPDAGCDWLGIAGQVFSSGAAQNGLVVEVSGMMAGKPLLLFTLTGNASAIGPGGFEIRLADHPILSEYMLKVRVKDIGGNVLSYPVPVRIDGTCDGNLVIVNFTEYQTYANNIYLPAIRWQKYSRVYLPMTRRDLGE